MYKIGVIGDSDSICGYAALGLDIFPVSDPTQAAHTLKKLCAGDYAIIYITEQMLKGIESEMDKYSSQRIPAIIPHKRHTPAFSARPFERSLNKSGLEECGP